DDDGDGQVGAFGDLLVQADTGEDRGGGGCLAFAGLHEQVAARGQPGRRLAGDAAQHGQAVGAAVERDACLVVAGFGRQQRDLPGGYVGHVGDEDVDAAAQ